MAACLACLPTLSWAQVSTAFEGCAKIGAAPDRLACYDRVAGRAPSGPGAATSLPGSPPEPTSKLAPADTTLTSAPQPAAGSGSLMSKFWELDPDDKRGVFNFTGYRPNYILPVRFTSRVNRAPQSPTQATVARPAYRKVESKLQLSLRTKVAQGLLLPNADLWFAYTQQSFWQVYTGEDSKPFRNTDYEPEAIYIVPTPKSLRGLPFGWQWRYTQLGLAHQSNGQADPLSRSWNRIYLGMGFERGDWSLTAVANHRIEDDPEKDNNPDLTSFRGRGEMRLNWTPGMSTTSLLYRSNFKSFKRGGLQVEWTYPVYRDQPNGLRWYVQGFTGYGETLTDYNFRQSSIGAGLTFLQF